MRLDDPSVPIADTYRRVADHADRLGVPRPSYQRGRELVHESRRLRARRGPSTASVLLDVTFRVRPPEAVVDRLYGVRVPTRK